MTDSVSDLIQEYLQDDIPTSPGGAALVPCKHLGKRGDDCDVCNGSGWKMTMLRRIIPRGEA
jgi:hypothetical protein